MDFFETVRARRSIRAYAAREVEEGKLRAILECLRAAPSAGNLQAFEVVVVREPGRRAALLEATNHPERFANAPVIIAFFADGDRSAVRFADRGRKLYALQDATIACAHAQLAAAALGLATCWVGAFREEPVARLLGAPPGLVPVALLPIGYPAEEPPAKERRAMEDLVRWERL